MDKTIDGKLFYFQASVRNLFRLSNEASNRKLVAESPRLWNFIDILEAGKNSDSPYVLPERFRVHYTLTVEADAVPDSEIVKCWIIYPRECAYHKDIKLISSDPEGAYIAPPDQLQRTVYLEKPAVSETPTVFKVNYEFTTYAYTNKIDPEKIKPYDKNGDVYKKYTVEREPHIAFTPEHIKLAEEIVGNITNPYLKAQAIFNWIDGNTKYTSAPTYSTIPSISRFCSGKRTGDCGIQSILLITLCRISGVPAKWQSGWGLGPDRVGMHDWAEIYVEPYGWLPVDVSRGRQNIDDPELKEFYFGNIDNYRLYGNGDFSQPLDPKKKFFRSETVDFQIGEVEWKGGNLYYDKWDYNIDVKIIK